MWITLSSTLQKTFSRWHIEIFFLFFTENGIWHFMQMETICMKCQILFWQFAWTCKILFSGKNKKNITYLSSAELVQKVVKIKSMNAWFGWDNLRQIFYFFFILSHQSYNELLQQFLFTLRHPAKFVTDHYTGVAKDISMHHDSDCHDSSIVISVFAMDNYTTTSL